jgi:hypothetical protein
MKRVTIISLLLLLSATLAFAHAGEVHTYLGTITKINTEGSFVIKMTNGKERTVLVSKTTTYTHTDGNPGKHAELAVGMRVSAKISKDGKTALNVKFSAANATE